jgi:hypothetical protein
MKYIQAYLVNGTLPAEGTVCPVLGPPFNATGPSIQVREEAADVVEDRTAVDAILSKRWRIVKGDGIMIAVFIKARTMSPSVFLIPRPSEAKDSALFRVFRTCLSNVDLRRGNSRGAD